MDIFVMDNLLRRTEVIDEYISCLWAERYADVGDFQLRINADRGTRGLLRPGAKLAIAESSRIMTINTVKDTKDEDGVAVLEVSGLSLEDQMRHRAAHPAMSGLEAVPKWLMEGTPTMIAEYVFRQICVTKILNPNDGIPFLMPGGFLPRGNIPAYADIIRTELEPDTLYGMIKRICDTYNLGFRLIRKADTSEVYFDVYTGNDRTSAQSIYPPVIFSEQMDNLSNSTLLEEYGNSKNVAYVFAKYGSMQVYAPGVSSNVSGFNRRVLFVKADDIDLPAGEDLNIAMEQRGREALAPFRNIVAFDGEIPQFASYKYNRDYELGDLVEKRNDDGFATNLLVTEQIFASDEQGDRDYPTLTKTLDIQPDTWFSWDSNEEWVLAEGTWSEK